MTILFDRLYGKLDFPPVIERLLFCPGLCRLREVAMANVPFLAFPAFAYTSRYEHSLGVCHLADLAAKTLGLVEKDRIELMVACLYHDVVTPPFAHAMEEVLAAKFGFDHETYLRDLLLGRTTDVLGGRTQVFLGRQLALQRICQSTAGRDLGLDLMHIADLAVGDINNPLANLVASDIDLDNIDNVTRASTAMGIRELDGRAAEALACSFAWHEGTISLNSAAGLLRQWCHARALLYEYILCSWRDFALQTMLKHAARILLDAEGGLLPDDWRLTDQEFVHQRAARHPRTDEIMRRMRLGDTYQPLAILWAEGDDIAATVVSSLRTIEDIASKAFSVREVVANYMIDKREREVTRPLVFLGKEGPPQKVMVKEGLLLGIFTPGKQKAPDRTSVEALKHDLYNKVVLPGCLSHVYVREDGHLHLVVERDTERLGTPSLFDMG